MKLSELTTGADGLKAGTEVFDKHGLAYGFDRELGNGEVLVEVLGVTCYVGYEGEPGEEELEGTGQYLVKSAGELFTERPKQQVPRYLDADIERAKSEAQRYRDQAAKSREEKAGLDKDIREIKERLARVSKKFPQLGYLCDFVEGVDLWVAAWNPYRKFELCKVSELKGEYGLRMVSIQTEKVGDWTGCYDWCLHEYSDDGGSKKRAILGKTKEECLKRVAEYLEEMDKTGKHWGSQVLKGMQESGVILPEKQVKYLLQKQAEQDAQIKKSRASERKRILEQAAKYGLELKEGLK